VSQGLLDQEEDEDEEEEESPWAEEEEPSNDNDLQKRLSLIKMNADFEKQLQASDQLAIMQQLNEDIDQLNLSENSKGSEQIKKIF
jgi:hypothetical protein